MTRSSEQLSDAQAGDRDSLTIAAVEELTAIRETLEEIREDLDWWLKNHRGEQWLPMQPITSMPKDPLAPDWAERLNRYSADDLAASTVRSPPKTQTRSTVAAPLGESVQEEMQFCCEMPDLQWTGDRQSPGVACQNCGYVVADCGSVVMQPSPQAERDPDPKERQQALFADA